METPDPEPSTPVRHFAPWVWRPFLLGIASLGGLVMAGVLMLGPAFQWAGLALFGLSACYFLIQTFARILDKQGKAAIFAFARFVVLCALIVPALWVMMMYSAFGPSEDHFADSLAIPHGIDIAEPASDPAGQWSDSNLKGTDTMQLAVRGALQISGGDDSTIIPSMPSLRRAATEYEKEFRDYIEASPDWGVFFERGNRFAARRWSYDGEPRDTLHGYISEFHGDAEFQTRALLCLDQKQWSYYKVQHAKEGTEPVKLDLSIGNQMYESRLMIECGGVWIEIFEESKAKERLVTKATMTVLETEFAQFLKDPPAAVVRAKQQSRDLALRLAGADGAPFRLVNGMQPGIYVISYSLNPGEPGIVYLKACEVTKGTPLSEDRLKEATETRLTWSADPKERFGAKAGFTIYEGDWGKPYAARFEVWFKPDSGKPERKLAERIFKIEGWQR